MSVLAPLYLLGLAAISLPLVLHLIRRTPRGEMLFSSLLFLQPSPPRLTKRSRLDNLLLLLLRGLALTLLAVAFARPFLRQAALVTPDDVAQQHVAVLVDSKRQHARGDLWPQAIAAVDRTLAEYRPQDRFAVYAFDETVRPIASFDDLNKVEAGQRRPAVAALLKEWQPTWSATRTGQALADALALLAAGQTAGDEIATAKRVVLISDLQAGSHLEAFSQHEWPQDAALELVALELDQAPDNAGLELLADTVDSHTDEQARDQRLRVRVTNAAVSQADTFQLQWQTTDGHPLGHPLDVHVPAGESRVVRLAAAESSVTHPQLVLDGDAFDFDNTLYYLPPRTDPAPIVYIGDDRPDDSHGMAYFLEQAVQCDASRQTVLTRHTPDSPSDWIIVKPQLVVATCPPSPAQTESLQQYLADGGRVLYVVTGESDTPPLVRLLQAEGLQLRDVKPTDYAMLSQIDFAHPMFGAMAGPQYSNFTQIYFWRYWQIAGLPPTGIQVLARFDSGDPAILQRPVGKGELLVMAAGWQPDDSQLARSWKFVLMLSGLIDSNRQGSAFESPYQVNQRVPVPPRLKLAAGAMLHKPDGQRIPLASDAPIISDLDQPGVYGVDTAAGLVEFAVQLDPTESETTPLAPEAFEQAGMQTTPQFDAAAAQARMQQLRDVELEGRQKVWKWLVALALLVLVAETLLAAWQSRPLEAAPAAA